MRKFQQRTSPWLPWATVILLAGTCGALAVMQYRWIIEFSAAERDRMRADLQSRLGLLSSNLNEQISADCTSLFPDAAQIERLGRERSYAAQFAAWLNGRATKHGSILFRQIALVTPHGGSDLVLETLDFDKNQFVPAPWPPEWIPMRDRLLANFERGGVPPPPRQDREGDASTPLLFEFPRFGESPDAPGVREQEWLLIELDDAYIRGSILPPLVDQYLANAATKSSDYETEITLFSNRSVTIQAPSSGRPIESSADASVGLLNVQPRISAPGGRPREGRGPGRGDRRLPPPDGFGPPPGPPPDGPPDDGPPPNGRGFRPPPGPPRDHKPPPRRIDAARANLDPPSRLPRWRLYVRHRAGSLEAIADRARNRNILISGGLLVMILAIVAWLFRLSRQSQRLAESHMNFVAGVSHELRTPLTVIRTAAYNLRGRLAARPDQVERYGKLIQEESEKLGALVEQVLQFASGEAGHLIRERERVAIGDVIEESLQSNVEAIATQGIQIEKHIDPDLPLVLADRRALKHALQNLIENAIKYGKASSHWIGVFASATSTSKGPTVEIRIADHGPGIPAEEQPRIFDAFFRGRRAVADQVHGTGLGLNLVRQIVEAHGATIEVTNGAASGAEFIVRIPVAPPDSSTVESVNGVKV